MMRFIVPLIVAALLSLTHVSLARAQDVAAPGLLGSCDADCLALVTLVTKAVAATTVPSAPDPVCHVRLGAFDRWIALPFAAGAAMRDSISTVLALKRDETAREANGLYASLNADPQTHPEAFAWVKGGMTAAALIHAGTSMTSCNPKVRLMGRLTAVGQGVGSLWIARRNDRIGVPAIVK